ncbi:MAG: glycosyltransferase [Hydrogenophaga sp.]|uniref:glycosyltransferase n=1 Tax=Hydrogenophaga sp. TaxID=1904254 RepID=UPI0027232E8B|nr:glycosyltransferase [Hydrogenophaga sp.]MDO9571496.1 glycosyltransferase [Hydrogenophaga sp.]MDP3376295.1 glycosyltransferase [Hydrogenophaga sp.]
MSLTINVLFEHDRTGEAHGCSHIRLLRPLGHPSLAASVRLITSHQLAREPADVVIVERWWKPDLCEQDAIELVAEVRQRGATLIYTLDDNLLDLGLDEEGNSIAEETLRATRYFIRTAHGLIVSTPALAQRLSALNSRVIVLPNALDERLFKPKERDVVRPGSRPFSRAESDDFIRIGYMGTLTHAYDLKIIVEPLRKLLYHYADSVRLEIVGVSAEQERIKRLFGTAVKFLEPTDGAHYECFANWFRSNVHWDIGLAPLSSRQFNQYKSDIKYLDYGILGIPGIFSKIGPYPASVLNGVTGILVDNNVEAWYRAMEALVQDEDMRKQLGERAFKHVHTERTLEARAGDWIRAISEIRLLARNVH